MKNDQYFPHDATAGNNLKLMALIQAEGVKGYGIYWLLLEFLRQQQDYRARLEMLEMLSRRARTNTTIMRRIITNYALFVVVNEEWFYSPGLCNRMQPLDDKRSTKSQQCRLAAKAKWLKDKGTTAAGALQEKESKEKNILSLTLSGGEGEEKREEEEVFKTPPEYAFNKQTHNLDGLLEKLSKLQIKNIHDVNAILQLSDYGRLGHKIWGLLYHTQWEKIKAPGRFLIAGIRGGC